jgi:FdhD protein
VLNLSGVETMSDSSIQNLWIHREPGGAKAEDWVVVEEPLEIRVEGTALAVTMRTPGHDRELAAGFLYTEGCVDGADDFQAIAHVKDPRTEGNNIVDVRLAAGTKVDPERLASAQRAFYASSSCGLCGKTTIDRVLKSAPPVRSIPLVSEAMLRSLPARMRAHQEAFSSTGGLHAAALVTLQGEIEVLREDVGRHNAVDKVLGWRLLRDEVPVDDRILLVSGRAGYELVQKAVMAGVPAMAAVGAPSSMAVDLARRSGLQLVGFLKSGGFNRYSQGTPEEIPSSP